MQKIDEGVPEENSKIAMVLWGIWCWRNKKVWEDKLGSPSLAMDWSSKIISDWRKVMEDKAKRCNKAGPSIQEEEHKWRPPEEGYVKVNVDAAVQQASQTCSLGMVIRDHQGNFVEGRTMKVLERGSVFAAEALGVCEALKWSDSKGFQKVIIETDSLLTARALSNRRSYALEVGHVLQECLFWLDKNPHFVVKFIRRQANKVAHLLANCPCLVDCYNVYTSPPAVALETVLFDSSS